MLSYWVSKKATKRNRGSGHGFFSGKGRAKGNFTEIREEPDGGGRPAGYFFKRRLRFLPDDSHGTGGKRGSGQNFSIGFEEKQYDESGYASAVAKHLGTLHTEEIISEKQMLELVESIPQYSDEPMADSSQIPTMLVSALARKQVTVALSGDGGDEFFCG